MKKLLPLVLLLAAAGAHAEWKRIDAPFDDVTLYVDHDSASVSADRRVSIYHILDYKSLQKRDGREFRSEMFRYEYDCVKGTFHALGHTWHKGQMGGDKMVHFSEGGWYWTQPEAGSVDEVLLKTTCSVY
jgi:hypothetical protein